MHSAPSEYFRFGVGPLTRAFPFFSLSSLLFSAVSLLLRLGYGLRIIHLLRLLPFFLRTRFMIRRFQIQDLPTKRGGQHHGYR